MKVVSNFGSSATLAQQITRGAPVDVFASASPATMKTVTDAAALVYKPCSSTRPPAEPVPRDKFPICSEPFRTMACQRVKIL
ncbi:hypothetical protein GCM10010468_45310 [Actinocorallia longicatena]|uniref:Uncharacterized protein n=1 Tax=Actinocorallia longicatena TaxID=111803 RepID=A0ABP6QCU1_9ACTN